MYLEEQKIHTTALEDWVTRFYLRLGIVKPEHINVEYIAKRLEIFIHKKEMSPTYSIIGRYKAIVVDSRESKEVQREMFFHELCHLLRHCGIQSMMPNAFRELQEWDARHFTKYSSIPFHMLKYIDIEDPYVIDQMVSMFKVTPELCVERLLQIKIRKEYTS